MSRTPHARAVRFRVSVLSYAELDERANQLSHRLVELGATADSLVAVCMDRSLDMVVSLHAVLKAGAAYVPIDPEYPADRIAFMVDDAQAPIVLTREWLAARFEGSTAMVISVDSVDPGLSELPTTSPGPRAGAEDLACVIYTSGSTGRPKGAMISNRAISNRIAWMQDYFELTAEDKILQKTPFSFDVSVWEFFWPLLYGAELVVAEPGGHRDSTYLIQTVIAHGITTIHFVPSMLQLLLEDPRVGECDSLRRVICSGEALPRALQDRFFSELDTELHNLYGPTEAAVDVTAWACDPSSTLPFVPIGKPIANTQMHILDEAMRPVPVGTAGELHIGGVQVGRGYLNRSELTAERFVPDPFRADGTLYKTGDLSRYLPDGNIQFLGRSDFQVKIRGFRVELGEIEAALEAIEGVRQAVVAARERASGDLELVAYVAHPDGSEFGVDDIKVQLASRLPDYMVPTTFVVVERFTLSTNGKIDRKALPAPTRERPDLGTPYVAARTSMELIVSDAWRELLDLDRIGRDDRFFELGGTSLQAARFVNQMQTRLGESIFVVTLFSAPSVAEYAALLERSYPASVAKLVGADGSGTTPAAERGPITEADIDRLRSAIPLHHPRPASGPPNPPAIFILSPPRSGTTLLRTMLAGHPGLFAASELQLLHFTTMSERAGAYSGRHSNWLDGAVRAIMELDDVDADAAKAHVAEAESGELSTSDFFGQLQSLAAPRTIVDKSPSYGLDPSALVKSEQDLESTRYVHLVRSPGAMIDSFERHHMEQVLYLEDHRFDSRQLAELVWTLSHRTIAGFLGAIPEQRWHRLRYEDLVRDPEGQMRALCDALGLEFDPAVVQPYAGVEDKMVDGVYAESAPMGDPGFLGHGKIDSSLAEDLSATKSTPPLGKPTLALAADLGYAPSTSKRRDGRAALTSQRSRRRAGRDRGRR